MFLDRVTIYINTISLVVVRLANGPTRYEGRVEVYHNGEWGTVCDDGWDLNDAQVVCSELDLGKAVDARHSSYYGQGSGPIWLDDLHCVGNEQSIGDCTHLGWGRHYCYHSEDAGVKCSPPVGKLLLVKTLSHSVVIVIMWLCVLYITLLI